MNLYVYEGPILEFGRCIVPTWSGKTQAVSSRKAKSNLTYQAKMDLKKKPNSKVILPGTIVLLEEDKFQITIDQYIKQIKEE